MSNVCLGHQAKYGCHRCWLRGTSCPAIAKIRWPGNHQWLDYDSPIRQWFPDEKDTGNKIYLLCPLDLFCFCHLVCPLRVRIIIGAPLDRSDADFGLFGSDIKTARMGYIPGGCALSGLDCPFDIRRQVALDLMHLTDGIVGDRMFALLAGRREVNPSTWVSTMNDTKEKENIMKQNAEIRHKLNDWTLSKPDQKKVDRRWASVHLPHGYGTNYVPFADHSVFTSADWFHLMVYAGRWIMDGILFGMKLQVWLRLCRVFESLSRNAVKNDSGEHEEMRRLVIETVALCEKELPETETVIKFHNLIHLVDDIIDKGPVHGYWLFRFERQWGAITQRLRVNANRARPEASLIRIIKGQWRFVHPNFITELDAHEAMAPGKSRAIRSWQGKTVYNAFWNDKEAVAISRGDWKCVSNWIIGGPEEDAKKNIDIMTEITDDLLLPLTQAGDCVSLEVCSDLSVMHRRLNPYRGTFQRDDIYPYEKSRFLRSFVSINADRRRCRMEKCAGQVEGVYRITIERGGVKIITQVACKVILFKVHKIELLDGPQSGTRDHTLSRMSIIKKPFSIWTSRRGRARRPRFIGLHNIHSACLVVPRVRVPASMHADIRYHEYHLIELRR